MSDRDAMLIYYSSDEADNCLMWGDVPEDVKKRLRIIAFRARVKLIANNDFVENEKSIPRSLKIVGRSMKDDLVEFVSSNDGLEMEIKEEPGIYSNYLKGKVLFVINIFDRERTRSSTAVVEVCTEFESLAYAKAYVKLYEYLHGVDGVLGDYEQPKGLR